MPVQHFIRSLRSMILFKIGCFYVFFPRLLIIYLIKRIEIEGLNKRFCLRAFQSILDLSLKTYTENGFISVFFHWIEKKWRIVYLLRLQRFAFLNIRELVQKYFLVFNSCLRYQAQLRWLLWLSECGGTNGKKIASKIIRAKIPIEVDVKRREVCRNMKRKKKYENTFVCVFLF